MQPNLTEPTKSSAGLKSLSKINLYVLSLATLPLRSTISKNWLQIHAEVTAEEHKLEE